MKTSRILTLIFLLTIAFRVTADTEPTVSVQAQYQSGESVTINYANLPVGATIMLYKDLSLQPMREMLEVSDEQGGVFTLANTLEPGSYEVRSILNDTQVAEPVSFIVSQPPFKRDDKNILVLSDIHVMAPELLEADGAAMADYVASDRKMIRQSAEIFTTMVDSIIHLQPELLLISGDLTKDGERLSHEYVVNELNRLRDAGISTLVIPGNHDCNNPAARYFNGSETRYAETVTRDEFADLYHNYGYGESSERDPNSLSYVCEPFDGLVVVGIDSNRDEENLLTCRGDSADVAQVGGRVKPETLDWIQERMKEANAAGKRVIAMMHHHLIQHFDKEASLLKPYIIEQNDSVRDLLMEAGLQVLFTGHLHVPDIARCRHSSKADTLTEVSSGALVGYPHPFRVVTLNTDNTVMSIDGGLLRSIPSMPDLQRQSNATLQACIPSLIRRLAGMYFDKVIEKVGEMIGDTELIYGLCDIPEDTDELADIVNGYLGDQAKRSYLLMAEGNEGMKFTDDLRDEVFEGVDNLFYRIVLPEYAPILRDVYLGYAYPKLDTLFVSVYNDINNLGKPFETVVNDLYTTLNLGSQPISVTQPVADANHALQVVPTVTTGPVSITSSTEGLIEIYNLSGHLIYRHPCRPGEALPYRFNTGGIYIVRGRNHAVKVIVH